MIGWQNAHVVVVNGTARQEGDTILVQGVNPVSLRVPMTATVTIADCQAEIRVESLSGRLELARIQGDVSLRGVAEVVLGELEGDLSVKGAVGLKGEGTWQGDVSVRDVTHSVEIGKLEGDASLDDVGTVGIQELDGDLSASGIRGDVRLGDVSGDVSLRALAGDLNIAHGSGDLIAQEARGLIDAPEIEGDAVISLDEVKGVILRADGDVVLNLPAETNAGIELHAPHGDWVARVPVRITEQDEHHLRGTLGSGGARIEIESTHDDVIVRVAGAAESHFESSEDLGVAFAEMGHEMAEMGERIAREVRQSVKESLARSGIHGPSGHHFHPRRDHEPDPWSREPETQAGTQPQEPVAGSPERQAILDAIARGELSVDEAIRKLRGEE